MKGELMDKLLSACPYRVGSDEQGSPTLLDALERANDQLTDLINRDSVTDTQQHRVCTCFECINQASQPISNRSTIPPHLREDLYGIEEDQLESIPSELLSTSNAEDDIHRLPISIHGPDTLQSGINNLLPRYKQQFCTIGK